MLRHTHNHKLAQGGFTLMEMSIVLVILGLVIGGVFVGRDMIEAANIRSTISDKQEYDVAVMTFINRFGALPGDVRSPRGIPNAATRAGTDAHGDGDWVIESDFDSNSATYRTNLNGEFALFWSDLYNAGLIKRAGNASADTGWNGCSGTITADNGLASRIPKSNWSGVYWFLGKLPSPVTSLGKQHYLTLAAVDSIDVLCGLRSTNLYPISTIGSKQIDTKMDDGEPLTGSVTAILHRLQSPTWASSSSDNYAPDGNCVSGTAYNLASSARGCALLFKMTF